MATYRSARGRVVDMEKLRQANEEEIAVTGGSQNVNARGDELGPGGRIIRTREEIIRAYNQQNPKAVPDEYAELVPDQQERVPTPDAGLYNVSKIDPNIPAIPIDELYVKTNEDEEKLKQNQNLIEMEEQRINDMNRRTAEMRQKRQEQRLAEQTERLAQQKKEIKDLVDEGNKIAEELHPTPTQSLTSQDVREETFMDELTGKTYKSRAALKAAITRRVNKVKKDTKLDNVDPGIDNVTWAE